MAVLLQAVRKARLRPNTAQRVPLLFQLVCSPARPSPHLEPVGDIHQSRLGVVEELALGRST